jgi:hypothetical protein
MPTLQCPECGVEWAHTGGNTAVSCPNPTCGGHVQVGGPTEPRESAGLSIREVRDRIDKRGERTAPP